jgi:hypothetical protein
MGSHMTLAMSIGFFSTANHPARADKASPAGHFLIIAMLLGDKRRSNMDLYR